MNYLSGILQMIALDVDFYDSESYQGNSIVPFLCFMGSLAGLVILIIGVAKYSTAKRNWTLFYDQRDSVNLDENKAKTDKKVGLAMIIIGAVMMIAFYIATM